MNPQPIPPLIELSVLGTFFSGPDFPAAGESDGIWRIPSWPGHLYKRFNADAARKLNPATLDRLIAEPATLSGADQDLIAESTAWPVGRVVDGGRTVGVVMPEAPDTFAVSWLAKSRTDPNRHSPLKVDYLAKPDAWLASRGITRQSAADRAATCLSLARVACLLERCNIVYADWSYTNAFWQPDLHTVFVFDIDGCSYGPRKHVFTPNFEDPLTPNGQPVDAFTDRYRVALLLARMLTGLRTVTEVHAALGQMRDAVPATLLEMLTAGERTARPSLADLVSRFGAPVPGGRSPDATGVVTWRSPPKINRPGRPTRPPVTNAPPAGPQGWRPRPGYRGPRTPGPVPTGPPAQPVPTVARARVPATPPPPPPPPPPTFVPPTRTPIPQETGMSGAAKATIVIAVLLILAFLVAVF